MVTIIFIFIIIHLSYFSPKSAWVLGLVNVIESWQEGGHMKAFHTETAVQKDCPQKTNNLEG